MNSSCICACSLTWYVQQGKRQRRTARRMLPTVQLEGGDRRCYTHGEVSWRFVGQNSIELTVQVPTVPNETVDGATNDIEEVADETDDGDNITINASRCPVCRGPMDYDLLLMCTANCAVCFRQQVPCIVACSSMHSGHALCTEHCFRVYSS